MSRWGEQDQGQADQDVDGGDGSDDGCLDPLATIVSCRKRDSGSRDDAEASHREDCDPHPSPRLERLRECAACGDGDPNASEADQEPGSPAPAAR